jgi:hypothetical protein|nr:MAG TPA: Potassium voltage-gated channel subfamily KQT, Atrial fibrillation, Cell membrane.7A [Caudoviricetes sp.]
MTESVLTGLGTALAVVLPLVAALTPKARRFLHFIDDLMGEEERPGTDRRPGILERLMLLEKKLESIERRLNSIESRTDREGGYSGVDGEARR